MNKSDEVLIQAGVAGPISRWSVVETNLHQERTAKFHLQRRAFDAYLPMRANKSKRKDVQRCTPLFPNYLFVRINDGCAWSEVFGAIGVKSVLNSGGRPMIAPAGLVERIKGRELFGLVQMDEPKPDMPYRRGDRVRVVGHTLDAFDAIFEEALDAKRVVILFDLFGRRTRAEATVDQLRSVS